jgi:hypothetical protein
MFILFVIVSSRRVQHRRVKQIPSPVDAKLTSNTQLPPHYPGAFSLNTCPPTLRLNGITKDSYNIRLLLTISGKSLPAIIAPMVDRAGSIAIGDLDASTRVVVDTNGNRIHLDVPFGPTSKVRCTYAFSVDL